MRAPSNQLVSRSEGWGAEDDGESGGECKWDWVMRMSEAGKKYFASEKCKKGGKYGLLWRDTVIL